MDTYLDLSLLLHLTINIHALIFYKIIGGYHLNKKKIAVVLATSLIYFIIFLIARNNSFYYNLAICVLMFVVFYNKGFLKPLLLYLFCYYSLVSFINYFGSDLYLYKGLLHVGNPSSVVYALLAPISLIVISLVSKLIKSLLLLRKYHFKVRVYIRDKIYDLKGYFDSGNTLTINNLPVIFISESFLKTNLNTDEIKYAVVGGMGKSKCVKGEIIFKEEKTDVYYAFSNRRFFNGCDCLLNVYLSN